METIKNILRNSLKKYSLVRDALRVGSLIGF